MSAMMLKVFNAYLNEKLISDIIKDECFKTLEFEIMEDGPIDLTDVLKVELGLYTGTIRKDVRDCIKQAIYGDNENPSTSEYSMFKRSNFIRNIIVKMMSEIIKTSNSNFYTSNSYNYVLKQLDKSMDVEEVFEKLVNIIGLDIPKNIRPVKVEGSHIDEIIFNSIINYTRGVESINLLLSSLNPYSSMDLMNVYNPKHFVNENYKMIRIKIAATMVAILIILSHILHARKILGKTSSRPVTIND